MKGRPIVRWGGGFLLAMMVALVGMSIGRTPPSLPPLPTPPPPAPTAPTTRAARPEPATAPGPVIPPATGKWIQSNYRSATGDSESITFRLAAEREIAGRRGPRTPGLFVRCKDESTEAVYMMAGVATSVDEGDPGRHTVRVGFDDAPPETQSWRQETGDSILFSPDAAQMA